MIEKIQQTLSQIQKEKPVVLCLTNGVTMDFVANALLAVQAAPIMSQCVDELKELLKISKALYINLGTLEERFLLLVDKAVPLAKAMGIPIILDPVGSGASHCRTQAARNWFKKANIVKGNASEILSLKEDLLESSGVESRQSVFQASEVAGYFSHAYHLTMIVTGQEDLITDGSQIYRNPFGHEMMTKVTGMGCALGAVISAFAAVSSNYFEVACLSTIYYNLCGQLASQNTKGPASFKVAFLDALYEQPFSTLEGEFYDKSLTHPS